MHRETTHARAHTHTSTRERLILYLLNQQQTFSKQH